MAGFIDEVVLPAEYEIGERPFFEIVREVQAKARDQGLWCPFVPIEWGGMGLGHLASALVQIEVGRSFSYLGAWALNCMGPQDATMLTLIEHGTEAQKARYLKPLVNGDIRIRHPLVGDLAVVRIRHMWPPGNSEIGLLRLPSPSSSLTIDYIQSSCELAGV